MNDSKRSKKEIQLEYKQRKIIGGIYAITNTSSGKILLESALNLASSRNKFQFSQNTGSCISPKLQKDWNEFGHLSFKFEVLEEIEKKEDQSDKQFSEDVKLLEDLWREKYDVDQLY